jgi:saccharopine dehydrogenase-like NADP-dependent oxidoreductase
MLHQIGYTIDGEQKTINSSLVVKGEDNQRTAMAKTVGLPLAIAAKFILQGKWKMSGLQVPTDREIYSPVLEELEEHGIRFEEYVTPG